jgi:hypothetical protein
MRRTGVACQVTETNAGIPLPTSWGIPLTATHGGTHAEED